MPHEEDGAIRMGPIDPDDSHHIALYVALGRLVHRASTAEASIRRVFCALLDSKYAPVIAGGRMVSDLLQMCTAIVQVHREISDDQRHNLLAKLQACNAANQRRNRFVHDQVATLQGRVLTIRSRRLSHQNSVSWSNFDEIEQTIKDIERSSGELVFALIESLGKDAWYRTFEMQLEDARLENLASDDT
jgi:hypothetical protein